MIATEYMAEALARLRWQDPQTKAYCDFVLREGATATIGRSSNNDIQIAEQHVSRQHAVVSYRNGVFFIADLSSSNGTFVNDERVDEPFPLFAGDRIRLYVPQIQFLAADEADLQVAEQTGRVILPAQNTGEASLIATNGPQEGQSMALNGTELFIGRATSDAKWQIRLQDRSVSRPHAVLRLKNDRWYLTDLGSSNGTFVNGVVLSGDEPRQLADGDTLMLGGATLLFRSDWNEAPPGEPHTQFRTKGDK